MTEPQPPTPKDQVSTSDAACEVLCELAASDPSVWVLTGDVWTTARLKPFADRFPDRFINVGIAEQCMVGVAAGMATCGKLPVVAAFASMLSMRACEQIRTDVAYNNLNVKFIASAAGFSAAYAGPTHHATEDVAMLRSMANMVVVVPCDAAETREAVRATLTSSGPVYIRLGGRSNDWTVYPNKLQFEVGHSNVLRDGRDATLIACGRTVIECVSAADVLRNEGTHVRVIDMHTVKPIDIAAIRQAAAETQMIFTVEDHNVIGGLGGAVAEALSDVRHAAPLKRLGVPDTYAPIGSQEAILEHFGLTAPGVAAVVRESLRPILAH